MLKKIKERLKPKESFFKFKGRIQNNSYSHNIENIEIGNVIIDTLICSNRPFMVARIGATELGVINNYISNKVNSQSQWNKNLLQDIFYLSGVFPLEHKTIEQFATNYLDSIKDIDILGTWNNLGEDFISRHFCPHAKLIPLKSIEPYYFPKNPWSAKLKNKKVLVIHPFSETILSQQKRREALFPGSEIFPDFELQTLKAIQSLGQHPKGYNSWFNALEEMQAQIIKKDFDIAIIGAGAYGLPLASFIKGLGKQAIHMGGATQILFGIKGRRWDTHPVISKLYNEHWVYPSDLDKPENYNKVENGCYW